MTAPAQLPPFSFPLFVPANRPDRIAKALGASTDTVIVDLEDAVPADDKDVARSHLEQSLAPESTRSIWLRINAPGTVWHESDVSHAASLPVSAIMVAKSEDADVLQAIRKTLTPSQLLIALVESAKGVQNCEAIAAASDRMAFGSIDFALDIGSDHARDALSFARSRLVIAARAARQPAPLDGVTTAVGDTSLIADDAAYARSMGFGGKLLIHPGQIAPARAGFQPQPAELDWARRIVANSKDSGAAAIDGEMIDAPVLQRAQAILERAGEA